MKIPFNEIDRDLHKLAERRVEDAMNSVAQLLETKEQRVSLDLLLLSIAAGRSAGALAALQGRAFKPDEAFDIAAGIILKMKEMRR